MVVRTHLLRVSDGREFVVACGLAGGLGQSIRAVAALDGVMVQAVAKDDSLEVSCQRPCDIVDRVL